MSKLALVIYTEEKRGKGIEGDPIRIVKQYFQTDGILLADVDDWKNAETEKLQALYDALVKKFHCSESNERYWEGAHKAECQLSMKQEAEIKTLKTELESARKTIETLASKKKKVAP